MYDIAIIGGGPAGLTAAIYAARYKMNGIILASEWGGYMNYAHLIENWPGDRSVQGVELASRMTEHVRSLGLPMIDSNVSNIERDKTGFQITTKDSQFEAKRIILTSGTERKKLGIAGEDELLGKGVSYCATCDGFFYRDKTVAIIGSGDSACTSAVFMADLAKKIYLLYRSPSLKAEPIWIDKVTNNKKIELLPQTMPKEIIGQEKVEKIKCSNDQTLSVDGVFIEIGSTPTAYLATKLGLETDEAGYIKVDNVQKTNQKGVWAAGDITTGSMKFKQIVTATAEGAVALYSAYIEAKS